MQHVYPINGKFGKAYLKYDGSALYITLVMKRQFVTSYKHYLLEVGRFTSFSLNKDIVEPSFTYDSNKRPACVLVFSNSVKEQTAKLQIESALDFLLVKELVDDILILFSEVNKLL